MRDFDGGGDVIGVRIDDADVRGFSGGSDVDVGLQRACVDGGHGWRSGVYRRSLAFSHSPVALGRRGVITAVFAQRLVVIGVRSGRGLSDRCR